MSILSWFAKLLHLGSLKLEGRTEGISKKSEKDPDPKRIAVIAVHGVGTHPPFVAARAIGDMLSDLTSASHTPRYAPFTENIQRINVRRLHPDAANTPPSSPLTKTRGWGAMGQIADEVYRGATTHTETKLPDKEDVRTLDHLFMKAQIKDYRGEEPEDTFQMLRLQGKRLAQSSLTPERLVDIYEMYWADLSSVGNAFTSIFREFYQVILHLGSVGVNNVKAAAIQLTQLPDESKAAKRWKTFDRFESFAAGLLALPIAILNLILAALVFPLVAVSVMRTHLSASTEAFVAIATAALITLSLVGLALFRCRRLSYRMYVAPVCLAMAAIAIAWLPISWNRSVSEAIVAISALGGAGLGLVSVIKAYEMRRPGACRWSVWLAIFLAILFVIVALCCGVDGETYPVINECLLAIEVNLGCLGLAWLIFWVAYVLGYPVGLLAARSPKDPEQKEKARRTWWTARICLATPACAFFLTSFLVWAGVARATVQLFPGEENVRLPDQCSTSAECPPRVVCPQLMIGKNDPCKGVHCESVTYRPAVSRLFTTQGSKQYASFWVNAAISHLGVCVELPMLVLVLLGLLFACWGLAPSIAAEIAPLRVGYPIRKKAFRELTRKSWELGQWFANGFRSLRIAGQFLHVAVFLPPVIFLITYLKKPVALGCLYNSFALGGALGFSAFIAIVARVSTRTRSVVQVMLDVDNWLREHPKSSTPTARICGRYISLLKHILSIEPQYCAIVIIAHSQGTVITSDFLRYITAEKNASGSFEAYDPELKRLDKVPVYLFTMGSPLGQLYDLRFPYLYRYAGQAATGPVNDRLPDIASNATPDPEKLGVKRWWNAFRSGDYIGRYLWRASDSKYVFRPMNTTEQDNWNPPAVLPKHISHDQDRRRVEFCIGPGAHTHYWDGTAGTISEVLDKLIALA